MSNFKFFTSSHNFWLNIGFTLKLFCTFFLSWMSFDVSVWVSPAIWYSALRATIHTVNSSLVFSLFAYDQRDFWDAWENCWKTICGGSNSHIGLYDILFWLEAAPLLKSKQLQMHFPLSFSLPHIPTLLLFCHVEEPALRHKSHHMHKTRWRGSVLAFIQKLVFVLRNFSFVDAEILLLSWNIGLTSITCVK